MYFYGNISRYIPFITGETILDLKTQRTGTNTSLLRGDIPRLAPGAMSIINVWANTTKYDPYYITATFDEGSSTFPVFSFHDIESGRFPNILAAQDDAQVIQKLLVLFIILCVISFTIAVVHKKIKEIVKNRREGFKRYKITFDLYLAIPITILSAVLILYVCEQIPLSIIVPSLIVPPLDATEGASIDEDVPYKNIVYKQGDLLLYSGIFWGAVFAARSVLSYLIAKVLIMKLYSRDKQLPIPTQLLASTSTFIMGVPIASSIILFFSKSTYSISPVYLFFIFIVLDIIRMSVLVLVVPRITMNSNNLLYHGIKAITLMGGLIQLLLFGMLLKILWVTEDIKSDFLPMFTLICLIGGFIQLTQLVLTSKDNTAKWKVILAASISISLIGLWVVILYHITIIQDALLSSGLPVILGGIIIILLQFSYVGMLRLISIRNFFQTRLSLELKDASKYVIDSSSVPCFPVCHPITVKGKLELENKKILELENKNIKLELENEKVTFDDVQGRADSAKIQDATTDCAGNFTSDGTTPSEAGSFKFCAHFKGSSIWGSKVPSNKVNNSGRSLRNVKFLKNSKDKLIFDIVQKQPSESNAVSYTTRKRKMYISVSSGNFRNGKFVKKKTFRPSQVITFLIQLKDNDSKENDGKENDSKKPIRDQSNIELLVFSDNEVTKHLPSTDNDGRAYVSIIAPKVPSDAWTYQACYNGDAMYEKAYTPVQTYSTFGTTKQVTKSKILKNFKV